MLYHSIFQACFDWYRVIIRATNEKEHVYEFTVALENTTRASVCIQNVAALDILYVYSFFCQCNVIPNICGYNID